jgi:hypothetical protein
MGVNVSPGSSPTLRAGDLGLHDIADIAVDVRVKIRTNRLMDVTHAKGLGVWQKSLIPDRCVDHDVPEGQDPTLGRATRGLPDKILVQLQTKAPGREPCRIVHQIVGIIPSPRRESHPARGSETPVFCLVILVLETAEDVTEPGIRPVVHASKPQTLDKGLHILGRCQPRAWDPQRGHPARHGRIEAHRGGLGIQGRLYVNRLVPVGHAQADGESIREAIGRLHRVDLNMPSKVHHTAPKRRGTCWQTKRGLHATQVRKDRAIELTVEIDGDVFGATVRRKALRNRQGKASLCGDTPPALWEDTGIVSDRRGDREAEADSQEVEQPQQSPGATTALNARATHHDSQSAA